MYCQSTTKSQLLCEESEDKTESIESTFEVT